MDNIKPHHYDEAELFLCDCSDSSHQMVFQLFPISEKMEENCGVLLMKIANCQLVFI